MGYIIEPKNVDLTVGPSVLTDDSKQRIAHAIEQYKKLGKRVVGLEIKNHPIPLGNRNIVK